MILPSTPTRGSILLLVLVFGSIFFIILGGLVQLVLVENRAQDALIGRAQSFSIAEAGLEYYAWFLAHFPDDLTNGTGAPGPYVLNYTDPETGVTGTYTLSMTGSSACGSTQMVDITSAGVSNAFPATLSTLVGRYATPSVAAYRELVNDGSSSVDFATLATDYNALKAVSQASGIFLPRHEIPQDPHLGYHITFNSDRTVTITLVTAVSTLRSVKPADGSQNSINDYTLIQTEEPYQTLPIPTDCGLIYSEDNTWIDGVVSGKTTLIASKSGGAGSAPDIVLLDDLTYTTDDGTDGLTVIAEHDILIAPNAPTNLTVNGIFIAVDGIFGRNNYYSASGGCTGLYEPRGTLTIVGTIVSNHTPKTLWPNGCGSGANAGYQSETHTADPGNATNPPPYTPSTSSERTFVRWQQTR